MQEFQAFQEKKKQIRRGNAYASILRTLIDYDALSKKDIAEILQLTPSSITQTANSMLEEGILLKLGEIAQNCGAAGRKKELICLNAEFRYVFGINIEADNIYLTLCNLRATPLYNCVLKTPKDASDNPDFTVRLLSEKCLEIMKEKKISVSKILGCGITLLGRVDNLNNVALDTYGVWNSIVDLNDLFSRYLPFPIIAENNANALAIADLLFGKSKTCQNVVFLKWIPGVGGAIVENGQLVVGKHFGAGEFGHIYSGENNDLCRCGKRGCLETSVSVFALSKLVRDSLSAGLAPNLLKRIDGDFSFINEANFRDWILTGDADLDSKICNRIKMYATKIANILNILSPEKVVFFGKGFLECPEYFSIIEDVILSNCPFLSGDDLALTSFRDESYYIGGAAVAINRLLLKECGV